MIRDCALIIPYHKYNQVHVQICKFIVIMKSLARCMFRPPIGGHLQGDVLEGYTAMKIATIGGRNM